jgi:transposase
MFIKRIEKKNKNSDKVYVYHRLMESYRTQNGPRQRHVLDLGTLDIGQEYYKTLADRIEDIVYGRQNLIPATEEIESLAAYYSSLIIKKTINSGSAADGAVINKEVSDYENIDLNSLNILNARTVGAEYAGLSILKELEFDKFLYALGFSPEHVIDAQASIIAKLVHPSSEHFSLKWLKGVSGLEKLLDASFTHMPLNRLYRISDKLLEHKEEIEEYLKNKERDIFSLKENIILYDLTNTYFEGSMQNAGKAAYGRSKEKRSDCPLLTLALVIDEKGFIKKTKIFKGNVSEPKTLADMLYSFEKNATVVMDAGIASEDNINLLKEKGFNYICVSRKKYDMDITDPIPLDDNLSVKLYRTPEESILYCESKGKKIKETSIANKARTSFENKLNLIIEGLAKKYTSKNYDKIHERISRLKEKYSSISQYYAINIEHNEIVEKISYAADESKISRAFSGSYYIRTNRTDLDEQNIKEIYTLLLQIENSFRTLKSQLSLRPNFHQKQDRIEAHIFITTLAYRLLNSIAYKLKAKNINKSWKTVKLELSTHTVNTLSMHSKDKKIYITACSVPESAHLEIYSALGLNPQPIPRKKIIV